MVMPDVNVLVQAFRADSPGHAASRKWLESALASREPCGLSELVLSGVLRVLTHPRVFNPPTPLEKALAYIDALRAQPNVIPITPGARQWDIFADLVRRATARGNLVADAYHAATAIEHGAEWITTDRDFSRFDGLRGRHPNP
jgi:toxin-antitoxin system PIN domain toxin